MCAYCKLHTSAYYFTDSNHIAKEHKQSADLFMLFLLIVQYILLVLLR